MLNEDQKVEADHDTSSAINNNEIIRSVFLKEAKNKRRITSTRATTGASKKKQFFGSNSKL